MKRCTAVLVLGTLLTACGGGGGSSGGNSDNYNAAPSTRNITLPFKAVAAGVDIACNTTYTLGSADTAATLEDFRFYVHDLRLVTSAGTEVPVTLEQNDWQNGTVALLDFQNKADKCAGADKPLHTAITGTVPNDNTTITGVRFNIGVPEDRNHLLSSSAPSPLNTAALFWSWQSGYKFMRLDFAPVDGGTLTAGGVFTAWNFHLGSTGCTGLPQNGDTVTCSNLNRPAIELTGFDPATASIQLDYSALVANSNIGADAGGASGCMSGTTDPECPELFTSLGLNLASGTVDSSLLQTAFSVVP